MTAMNALYDQIGRDYASQRRPDPRIMAQISEWLNDTSSLLNVGAGTGSYEPTDMPVFSVEPSIRMIRQRQNQANAICATSEFLPFPDSSFDATMAILTIHHWTDKTVGLKECVRVTRGRLIIVTWDPDIDDFWLVQDYFPDILAYDRSIFPNVEEIRKTLGPITIQPLPIPADCTDGFLGAFWRRPDAYLNTKVRSGISSFSRVKDVDRRMEKLRKDIDSGVWERRYRHLLSSEEIDIGYRIITIKMN